MLRKFNTVDETEIKPIRKDGLAVKCTNPIWKPFVDTRLASKFVSNEISQLKLLLRIVNLLEKYNKNISLRF